MKHCDYEIVRDNGVNDIIVYKLYCKNHALRCENVIAAADSDDDISFGVLGFTGTYTCYPSKEEAMVALWDERLQHINSIAYEES